MQELNARRRYDPFFQGIRTLLSLHNVGYQGLFDPGDLWWLGFGERPEIHSLVAKLVHGDPVLLGVETFNKPARVGTGVPPHQDNAYFKIPDPLKGTALWTAVHDATIANGTMNVVPAIMRTT